MAARTKARRRAVEVLYEVDLRGQSVEEGLQSLAARMQAGINPYTEQIVQILTEAGAYALSSFHQSINQSSTP